MAGIFPTGGVIHTSAINTVNVPTVAGCAELFHSTTRCQPKFDPAAANAIISEMLNFMNSVGHVYDCSTLTNLTAAMGRFAAAGGGGGGSCNCPPSAGAGVPTATPSPTAAPYYVDTSTSPQTLYYWDGTVWNQLGAAQGLTTTQINGLIAAQIAASPNPDTDISAVTMAVAYPIAAPTGNSPINVSTTVTEDATVLTGTTTIPYWSTDASGVVHKASGSIADQDFDLGLGNLESIAIPVGVGGATGLNAQRGMTPRTTHRFVSNNFFVMTNRTFQVGVDARWPTLASVYEYLSHRVIDTEVTVTIQLPPGVIDLTTTGFGPMHPQPHQISVLGTAGTGLPAEAAMICMGYSAAARSSDAVVNTALLLAALPTILVLPQGGDSLWAQGDYGHGSLRDVTIRTGATGGFAVRHMTTHRNVNIVNTFFDGGGVAIQDSWLGLKNCFVVGDPAQNHGLRLFSGSRLSVTELLYVSGAGECGMHVSGQSSVEGLPSGVISVLRVEGCEIHNICLHGGSSLNTYGMRVEAHHSGEDNIEFGSGSALYLADDDGAVNAINCTNPNGAGFGAGNILVEGGAKIVTDLQSKNIELNLDGGVYAVKADETTGIHVLSGNFTNHSSAHVIANSSTVSLHDPSILGGITCDAGSIYTIYASDGALVNTHGMPLPNGSFPVVGTPNLTTLTCVN